jgi:hypothetical protein
MTDCCIRPEEMGDLEALASDHPVRLHLEKCPRCQAMFRTYRSFLEDADPAPRSELEARADAVLAEVTSRQFGLPPAERRSRGRSAARRWWQDLSRGTRARIMILTPVVATAAVVVMLLVTGQWPGRQEPVYRGPEPAASWRLEASRAAPEGPIRLRWAARPGADSYRVRLLDTSLTTVFESPALADTSTEVDPSAREIAAGHGDRLLWQVIALRQGEVLEESAFGVLQIP